MQEQTKEALKTLRDACPQRGPTKLHFTEEWAINELLDQLKPDDSADCENMARSLLGLWMSVDQYLGDDAPHPHALIVDLAFGCAQVVKHYQCEDRKLRSEDKTRA